MQHLEARWFDECQVDKLAPGTLSELMKALPKQGISELSWPAYPYRPKVNFSIAHTGHNILLKYFVEETHLRCVNIDINAPVYEDSCVEFFIAFDESGYYNLEFNCLGTALVAWGKDRINRTFLDVSIIRQIIYEIKLSNTKEGLYKWELTLVIPVQLFTYHSIQSLHGFKCKANFYKCGDLTNSPHYLAWSRLDAPEPDFHLPQFFGSLKFE